MAWGQDALAQDWNKFQQILIFPPPDLTKEVAKKLLYFRGGGVIVLPDQQARLNLFPSSLLKREIRMDPPFQRLMGRMVWASEGYDRFRAWSF